MMYVVAIILGLLGYVLDFWALLATLAIVWATVAWSLYRFVLRRGARFYCAHCDRVFRADYLKARAHAPQITEVAR